MDRPGLISINGESYPCRMTMGAMVRYKRMTGKDVGTIGGGDVSDLVTLLYCCVASASKADGVSFDMDFETFADHLDAGAMTRFVDLLQGDVDGEKKTAATE